MKTIGDLQDDLYTQPNVGVATTVNAAIADVVERGGLTTNTELSFDLLEKIRHAIYAQARAPKTTDEKKDDILLMMMSSLAGNSGSNVEDSLRYIENTMVDFRHPQPQ